MMIRIGALLLFALPLVAAAEEVVIQKTWRGIIFLPRSFPGKAPKAKPSPLKVVRDAKGYDEFLKLIPKNQISRTRPAPPNKDPLLKKPPVDFTKHTLLYVSRPSMARPVFKKITSGKKEMVITVEFPRQFPAAHPIHIGTYTAVLIPRSDKPVQLRLIELGRKQKPAK